MKNRKLGKFLIKYNISSLKELEQAILQFGNDLPIEMVYNAVEHLNPNRNTTAAYFTDNMICDFIFPELPNFENKKNIRVMEPSVGAGNFLPYIAEKYKNKERLEISVVDIDKDVLKITELIFETYFRKKYNNISIKYIEGDYLLHQIPDRYDLIVGNPPYSKVKNSILSLKYKKNSVIKKSNNLFVFFLEKAMKEASVVSLIVPKSILNAPEYNEIRTIIDNKNINSIIDFGENGFKGVKIETINLIISPNRQANTTKVESITQKLKIVQKQNYITDNTYPSWLLYRNKNFDEYASKLQLGMFTSFRDRQIVNSMLKKAGKYRVLKSRNIGDNKIINIEGYDDYIDDIDNLVVKQYLNKENIVMIPNLSYAPRACFLPKNSIANGSIALLTTLDGSSLKEEDLTIFGTKEFACYYRIARNFGTRSLNIDKNSVYYFGIRRKLK